MPDSKKVFKLRKEGKITEALQLADECLKLDSDDAWNNKAKGWVLYDFIKERVLQDPPMVREAYRLLKQYAALKIGKPDILHSCMLIWATKVADKLPNYIEFVKWWDLKNIQDEDKKKKEGKDRKGKTIIYDSNYEKTLIALAKRIEKENKAEEIDWVIPYLDQAIREFPNNIWLQYRKGKLLITANKFDEARKYLFPIVLKKHSDFWVWSTLGDTYLQEDIEKSIACYCKGILEAGANRGRKEEFVSTLRCNLARIFINKEMLSEAKFEVNKILELGEQAGKDKLQYCEKITSQEWYNKTVDKEDNNDIYYKYQLIAEEIVYGDIKWTDAVVSGQADERKIFLIFFNNDEQREIFVKYKKFKQIQNLKRGTPIEIKVIKDGDNFQVFKVRKRKGEMWDIIPFRLGRVDNVNNNKGVSHVQLYRDTDKDEVAIGDEECLIQHNRFTQIIKIKEGKIIKLKCINNPKSKFKNVLFIE